MKSNVNAYARMSLLIFLREEGALDGISISSLARFFGVSWATVQRDIDALDVVVQERDRVFRQYFSEGGSHE